MPDYEPWIGVDFDGTLATHTEGKYRRNMLGKPIPRMVERVRKLLNEGKRVKIFTARVANRPQEGKLIQHWLVYNGLPPLEVTNIKDPGLERLYDDRAIQVEVNTGKTLIECPPSEKE